MAIKRVNEIIDPNRKRGVNLTALAELQEVFFINGADEMNGKYGHTLVFECEGGALGKFNLYCSPDPDRIALKDTIEAEEDTIIGPVKVKRIGNYCRFVDATVPQISLPTQKAKG